MSKMNFSKKLGVYLAISISLFAFGATTLGDPFPWPVPSPRELMNDYGQLQKTNNGVYLHGGVDVIKDSTTYVVVAESGWVARVESTQVNGDTLDWTIAVGTSQVTHGEGWRYTHLKGDWAFRNRWIIDTPVNKGDTLGRVRYMGADPSKTHIHLAREWGLRINPDLDVVTAEWVYSYPNRNPLLVLDTSGLAQRHDPDFWGKRVVRDSTLDTLRWKVLNGDTFWIVRQKIDVETKAWYQLGNNYGIGAYKITYSIGGTGSQGFKGFIFSNRLQTEINGTDSAAVVAAAVYDTARSAPTVGCYIISNTDSMRVSFPYDSLSWLRGYWNTCQHRDRLWNQAVAESNSVARFPDGKCIVRIRGEDERGNYKLDSIKVIVNNFPPQVKQTYPVDGSAGVPRACTLRVLFDQPMDTVSAKAGFRLRLKGTTADIPCTTWFYKQGDTLPCDTLMLVNPYGLLQVDTVYLMKDSTSTKDIADSAMTSNNLVWFSTRDIEVHTACAFSDTTSRIEVRDSLLKQFSPPERYANYHVSGAVPVLGQRIAVDRPGNRYVCENLYTSGNLRIGKYNPTDSLIGSFLSGINHMSITSDGDYLYAVRFLPTAEDTLNDHYYIRVNKLTVSGDSVTSWRSPDSTKFLDIAYSPDAGKLFLSAWGVKPSGGGGYLQRDLKIFRYTTDGQEESHIHVDCGGDSGIATARLTVGKDRIYLARNWVYFSSRTRADTVAMYDWNLNYLGKFPTADSSPGGDRQKVYSLNTDRKNLYTLNRSWVNSTDSSFYWVRKLTLSGSSVKLCSLSTGWGTSQPYEGIAVYPSVLYVTGTEPPPGGGGGTDGGPQTDNLNSLLPKVYALGPSYPNPANGGLRIDYALPKESQVSLRVYNIAGQLVRTLIEGKEKPGFYKAEWDGKDQLGHRVSSGVYFYRMEAGEFRKTRKLVVVR